MQENIMDIKQESYHADGTKEDTEDANNPQDILYFQIKKKAKRICMENKKF